MTTPSPFLAWHAEAERLIEVIALASFERGVAVTSGQTDYAADRGEHRAAARAALSAHLLAVPIGEPRAWVCPTEDGDYLRSAPTDHSGWLPLFTKPEGMA